jgi:hypothetical protein
MAGFLDNRRKGALSKGNPVSGFLKNLSSFGMKYDDMILRNSRAVGIAEDKLGFTMNPMGADNDDMYYAFAAFTMADTSVRKNISFFDKSYAKRRDELRLYSLQDEIEEILDTLTDEAIVYDHKNFFCQSTYLSGNLKDEIKEKIHDNFKKIYYYLSFHDGQTAWNYFRKFLIDGYLAFEIIYNDDNSEIIGFKELDPISLMPGIDKDSNKQIWIQYKGQGAKERMLYDSQIIYISYSSVNSVNRVSYVERLIRSFNLLRTMEHTRIIWAVTNASFKMKFVIPVGGQSKTRAKQSLSQLMHNYREAIDFDYQSGEIKINGEPKLQFNKEYWMPSKNGETPEIETIGGEGPELSDTDSLKYFSDNLKTVSKIPFSRFDKDSPSTFELSAEGIMRDEIKFSKFVNRLRSIFQEIITKPFYMQMCLDYPELMDDELFKVNVGVKYNKENLFDELREIEITQKRIDIISSINQDMVQSDDEGNDIPYFDMDFLIKKYGNFSEDDIRENRIIKDIKKYIKEGYSEEDAKKIAKGEKKENFKKLSEQDSEEDNDNGESELADKLEI